MWTRRGLPKRPYVVHPRPLTLPLTVRLEDIVERALDTVSRRCPQSPLAQPIQPQLSTVSTTRAYLFPRLHLLVARVDLIAAFPVVELCPRDPADAGGCEICLFVLDAPETAELLVALLLPLGNQVCVPVPVLQQPVKQLARDRTTYVVKLVHVPAPLVVHLEDRRKRVRLGRSVMRSLFH